jgi:hypothetical protein
VVSTDKGVAEWLDAIGCDFRTILPICPGHVNVTSNVLCAEVSRSIPRVTAATLVITADRSKMHSVEKVRAYQTQIPNFETGRHPQ